MLTICCKGEHSIDMRAPNAKAPRWGVESDVESIKWNPHDPNFFFVSLHLLIPNFQTPKLTQIQDINRKRHNPLPRRQKRTLRPLQNKTPLDPPSPRRIRLLLRHQPHHPGLPRNRLHRQRSQTMEHPSQRTQHGRIAKPRRWESIRNFFRA